MSLTAFSQYLERLQQAYTNAGAQLAFGYTVLDNALELSVTVHRKGNRVLVWYNCATAALSPTLDFYAQVRQELVDVLGRPAKCAISEVTCAYADLIRQAEKHKGQEVTLIFR